MSKNKPISFKHWILEHGAADKAETELENAILSVLQDDDHTQVNDDIKKILEKPNS